MGVQNENNVEGSKFESAMNTYVGDTTQHRQTSEWAKMSAMVRGENYNDIQKRPSKDEQYLKAAEAFLMRSTCIRRKYGSVIVNNDEVISSGYNGSPRGVENCCDRGTCWRKEHNIPQGKMYEACVSVHSEMNAIMSAGRKNCIGGTLYLVGKEMDGTYTEADCCVLCKRMIKNSGIKRVVFRKKNGGIRVSMVDRWDFDDLTINE